MKTFKELIENAPNFRTGSEKDWETNAKSRGYTVYKNMTRNSGNSSPGYHKAKDKDGNFRGEYDSITSHGFLHER